MQRSSETQPIPTLLKNPRVRAAWVVVFAAAFFAGELQPARSNSGDVLWFGAVALFAVFAAALVTRAGTDDGQRTPKPLLVSYAIIGAIAFHLLLGPVYYRSGPIRGKVVDAYTETPIRQARVDATWRLRRPGTLEEDRPAGVLASETTRTDEDGYFTLPPWGPRFRPPFEWLGASDPSLRITTPNGRTIVADNAHGDMAWDSRVDRPDRRMPRGVPNRHSSKRVSLWTLPYRIQVPSWP